MSKDKLIYCSAGSELEPVFEITVGEDGVKCLKNVMVGDKPKMHNVQEDIQSHKNDVDIKAIVSRALNGDLTAIGSTDSFNSDAEAFDTTIFNKSINEIHQLNLQTEATLKASYNAFAGHDNVSYNEYVKLLLAGDTQKLNSYIGGKENGNDTE